MVGTQCIMVTKVLYFSRRDDSRFSSISRARDITGQGSKDVCREGGGRVLTTHALKGGQQSEGPHSPLALVKKCSGQTLPTTRCLQCAQQMPPVCSQCITFPCIFFFFYYFIQGMKKSQGNPYKASHWSSWWIRRWLPHLRNTESLTPSPFCVLDIQKYMKQQDHGAIGGTHSLLLNFYWTYWHLTVFREHSVHMYNYNTNGVALRGKPREAVTTAAHDKITDVTTMRIKGFTFQVCSVSSRRHMHMQNTLPTTSFPSLGHLIKYSVLLKRVLCV